MRIRGSTGLRTEIVKEEISTQKAVFQKDTSSVNSGFSSSIDFLRCSSMVRAGGCCASRSNSTFGAVDEEGGETSSSSGFFSSVMSLSCGLCRCIAESSEAERLRACFPLVAA